MASGRREDDTTVGEIYRRLVDMDERYEKKLDRIEEQVRLTNGRTTTLEANYDNLKSEIRSFRDLHPQTPPALPSVPVTTAEGESLSIKVSPKMWMAIVSAMSALWLLAQWAARWIEKLGPP